MSMQHLAPRLKLYAWTLSGGFQSCGELSWWQSSEHLCITLFSSQQLCVTLLRHIYTCYKYFLSNKIVRTRSHMQFEPNILAKQPYGHEACHSISSVPFCHSNVCVICLRSVILNPVNPIGASKPPIHLDQSVPDQMVTLLGFTWHRANRSTKLLHKAKGGGVRIMINYCWCTNCTELTHVCSPHLEYLAVNCRPSYLAQEFAFWFNYIYLGVDLWKIHKCELCLVWICGKFTPDTVITILGDSTRPPCHPSSRLLSAGNLPQQKDKETYRAFPRAPLGKSDYAMLLLIPWHRQKVTSSKQPAKLVRCWSPERQLWCCFACTDWDVLHTSMKKTKQRLQLKN